MVVACYQRGLIAFLGLCEGHYPVVEDILRSRGSCRRRNATRTVLFCFTYLVDGLDAERTDKLAGWEGKRR